MTHGRPSAAQVIAVQRQPGGGGAYRLGVCNTGEGCDPFHPLRAAAPTAALQRLLCLSVASAPAARVADGAFWCERHVRRALRTLARAVPTCPRVYLPTRARCVA